MGIGDQDPYGQRRVAEQYAEQYAREGKYDLANRELTNRGMKPIYGGAAGDEKPGIGTYLLGIGITVALLWPVITGIMGLIKNGVHGLAANFPLAFLLPSIGTSPLRGFLGITTTAVIVAGLPLILTVLIGPARAPKLRAALWVVSVLLAAFIVVLGTISWDTFIRAGMGV